MHPVFLVKRWEHHSPAGGYDQLAAAFPDATCVRRAAVTSRAAKAGRRVWSPSLNALHFLIDYQYGDFLAECRVLKTCATGKVDVVHALYGDEQLELLLRRRRFLRAGLVASFHLPTESVTDRWTGWQAHLARGIDAAVVVSRSQLADYRQWFGADRVVYIPHGINTERFQPGARAPGSADGGTAPLRLLSVGENMRDFEGMHRLADHCAARNLPVEIDAVLSREVSRVFTGCDNVRVHSGVPEDALIALYQRADALLLPVTGATANNAVLESLACGTPVITTAVGGMTDYVDEESGWLLRHGDRAALIELVEAMGRDRTLAQAKRAGARARALTFRWQAVAEQTRAVHEAVRRGLPPAGAVPS